MIIRYGEQHHELINDGKNVLINEYGEIIDDFNYDPNFDQMEKLMKQRPRG